MVRRMEELKEIFKTRQQSPYVLHLLDCLGPGIDTTIEKEQN